MCMTQNGYLKGPALQQHVEACLMEMLKEKSYQSITISDLCKRADVARKTFYSYYPTKDACFHAVVEHVIINVMMYTNSAMNNSSTTYDYYSRYLEGWKKQKWFLDVVRHNDLDFMLIQRGMYLIQSVDTHFIKLLATTEFSGDMDILRSYITCDFMLVLEWCSRGFDTPVEEMARKFVRLLHHPFIPMSESAKMWPSST